MSLFRAGKEEMSKANPTKKTIVNQEVLEVPVEGD
jgi:hypothetical protein